MWLPAYNVLLFVPMLLGMAALFVVPGLVGAESNLALFKLVVDSLPAWSVGVIGVAAALSSIVPMAVFMLVIGTMWGRSVLSLVPRWKQRQKGAAQFVVVIAGSLALLLTYTAPNTLVRLSLISYEGMAQLLPMVLLGLMWRRLTLLGAMSGLVVGVGVVCGFVFTENDPVWGVNSRHHRARRESGRRAGGDVRGAARARRTAGRGRAGARRDRGPRIGHGGGRGPSCITVKG